MKALSLFSGIGGLDIAAQACGIEPVAFCEIEPFPCEILKKRFPGVPILPDVRKVNGHDFRTVDVIFGGFPCQDLSVAGRRAGLLDENGNATRSGLWFEMLRIISEARPRFVVAENVRGAINAALDTVTRGLAGGGYEVRTVVIPASAVGAPHQRERLFILGIRGDIADMCTKRISGGGTVFCASEVADAGVEGLQGRSHPGDPDSQGEEPDDKQSCGRRPGVWRTPDAHADRGAMSEASYQERIAAGKPININAQVGHFDNRRGQLNPQWVEQLMGYPDGWTDPDCDAPTPWMGWPARPGEAQHEWEHPRAIVGLPHRAKRLKALGNSVVPQQAEPIFRAVEMIDKLTREK